MRSNQTITPLMSRAAMRLSISYGEQIATSAQLDEVLIQIKNWLIKSRADRQARGQAGLGSIVENIISGNVGQFRDPTSGITTRELLALTWLALHDPSKQAHIEEDERDQFEDNMHDQFAGGILETHNLSGQTIFERLLRFLQQFQDIGPLDSMGIRDYIRDKLKATVLTEAKKYIEDLPYAERQQLIEMWDRNEECDDINISYKATENVWKAIKDKVTDVMRQEGYQQLYDDSGIGIANQGLFTKNYSFADFVQYGVFNLEKKDSTSNKLALEELFEPHRNSEEKKDKRSGPGA